MKNNTLFYFIYIIVFLLSFEFDAKSQELQVYANEISSLNDGNKIMAEGGVKIKDEKGITINSDKAQYDKNQLIIKVENNVEIIDTINNSRLFTDEAIYFSNEIEHIYLYVGKLLFLT